MRVMSEVTCTNCGEASNIKTQGTPCPKCGHIEIAVDDALEFHSSIAMVERAEEGGKPILRMKGGDSLYRKTGEWNTVEQLVDRTNPADKRWRKTIVNSKGEVLRREDIPLPDKNKR